MDKIEIQIKHLSESSFKIHILPSATVLDLKREIEKEKKQKADQMEKDKCKPEDVQKERSIKAEEIKLIFKGKILKNDSDVLSDLKIENNSSLHMVHNKPTEEKKPESTTSSPNNPTNTQPNQQQPPNPFQNMGMGNPFMMPGMGQGMGMGMPGMGQGMGMGMPGMDHQ